MNALTRFFSLGMQDADRRLAAALEAHPHDAADRYLMTSAIVRLIDRATRSLQAWWQSSSVGLGATSTFEQVAREPWHVRYQALAVMMLTGVIVTVTLTLIQGPRPGWYWLVVPALAAMAALALLSGSRR